MNQSKYEDNIFKSIQNIAKYKQNKHYITIKLSSRTLKKQYVWKTSTIFGTQQIISLALKLWYFVLFHIISKNGYVTVKEFHNTLTMGRTEWLECKKWMYPTTSLPLKLAVQQ